MVIDQKDRILHFNLVIKYNKLDSIHHTLINSTNSTAEYHEQKSNNLKHFANFKILQPTRIGHGYFEQQIISTFTSFGTK